MKRLKLVLSCYACEPHRGSEPGVGWAWALGMAKRHDTYVLTRANNREVIEAELARLNLPESDIPKFIYVDLSPVMCGLKKRGIIPVGLYYLLWQFRARNTLDTLDLKADIIHHVTFNSFVCPGVWWSRPEKVVLGPIGGFVFPECAYLRLFRTHGLIVELIRKLLVQNWKWNFFAVRGISNADAVLFTDPTTRKEVGGKIIFSEVLLETAIPTELESMEYSEPITKNNQFVWAGVLEPRKGFEIAARAYAQAFPDEKSRPELKVFGGGREHKKYAKLVSQLGIEKTVVFCGKVSQFELWHEIRISKAFVFSSVRDTSGNVALEALALQTPLICFNHQGVATIADETCAIRITPGDWNTTIDDFARAMRILNDQPELTEEIGAAGRSRVLTHFTWAQKFDAVDVIYDTLLKQFKEKNI